MNAIFRKLLIITCAVCIGGGLHYAEAMAQKKIGILVWSEGSGYLAAKDGIIAQFKEDGFGRPKTRITVEIAKGNKAKAARIAEKFSAANMDMVISIGTSATVAATRAIKDKPVLFSVVFDPVAAKVAKSWKSSGNNTTGSSSKVSMDKLVRTLKQLAPIKTLGVLYTPGQKNSEAQLRELKRVQRKLNIRVIPVPITAKEEIPFIVANVSKKAEALFLTGSSIVVKEIPKIVSIATKAHVITVTHLGDNVKKGVLLGVSANPEKLGRLTAKKAIQVFKGKQPSAIPIETLDKLDIIVNMKTAKKGKIDVPAGFLKNATDVIE